MLPHPKWTHSTVLKCSKHNLGHALVSSLVSAASGSAGSLLVIILCRAGMFNNWTGHTVLQAHRSFSRCYFCRNFLLKELWDFWALSSSSQVCLIRWKHHTITIKTSTMGDPEFKNSPSPHIFSILQSSTFFLLHFIANISIQKHWCDVLLSPFRDCSQLCFISCALKQSFP